MVRLNHLKTSTRSKNKVRELFPHFTNKKKEVFTYENHTQTRTEKYFDYGYYGIYRTRNWKASG